MGTKSTGGTVNFPVVSPTFIIRPRLIEGNREYCPILSQLLSFLPPCLCRVEFKLNAYMYDITLFMKPL